MSVLLADHRERAFGFGEDWQRVGGLYLPPSLTPDLPLAMDLFAGCGGFSLGLHQAGFHVIAAAEWWPDAVETYLCNLGSPSTIVHIGTHAAPDATKKERRIFSEYGGQAVPAGVIFGDDSFGPGTGWISRPPRDHERGACVADVSYEEPDGAGLTCDARHGELSHRMPCEHLWMCDVYDLTGREILDALEMDLAGLDLVVGGPPCQGFSRANANASKDDPRNLLVFEFARLVCELKPRAMMMENVPAIMSAVTAEGVPIIDALALALEDGDFGTYEALRKTLRSTAGLGVATKGKQAKPEAHGEPDEAAEIDHEQLVLA